MADENTPKNAEAESTEETTLQQGTYEIIRNRLNAHSKQLRTRLEQLNAALRPRRGNKVVVGADESGQDSLARGVDGFGVITDVADW